MIDEELQQPLMDGGRGGVSKTGDPNVIGASRLRTAKMLLGWFLAASLLLVVACCVHQHCNEATGVLMKHHHYHGHVSYQATLKKNQQIEYSREFTAPCNFGILVFNVGPAAKYLPYNYDIYQDAYVFSNNKKLCWMYPTYRGIQKGPFAWWKQGDPTSFDVPVGREPQKISNRIVKPMDAKNFTAVKGGDFLIIAHGKFYTPYFYRKLKEQVNHWTEDDDSDGMSWGDFGDALNGLTMVSSYEGNWTEGGELEIMT